MKGLELQEIASRLGGSLLKDRRQIREYFIDSRSAVQGGLFFALSGAKTDGHHFLKEVAEKGAIGAVVSTSYEGPDFGLALIRVENVLDSLQCLARKLLEERKVKVVAITGSLGKTTTKDFTWTILSKKFRAFKSPLNLNSQISLPVNILNLEGSEELLVLEMGMTQKGQIEKLASIAPPDLALITLVNYVHSEFFSNGLEGIAEAKLEIFSQPQTKLGLIPYDLHRFSHLFPKVPLKTFSLDDKRADFYLQKTDEGFVIHEKGSQSPLFRLPFEEKQFIYNALAAISFSRLIGMSYEEILPSLGELKTPKMRFERIQKSGILFINDAYNAAPLSMRLALSQIPEPKNGGRKIAVLGEMPQLGVISDDSHREIGRFALGFVDLIFCLGEKCAWVCQEFQSGGKSAELFLTHADLAKKLKEVVHENDVVLLKGARIMQMEKILEFF
jgi:UDP-N-acetylmuramoyl-tripeptide--D-alanyl-D-alanine ligase